MSLGSSVPADAGKQLTEITIPAMTIDFCCNCTWIYSRNPPTARLKYRNLACPAVGFHMRLEALETSMK